jgi:hypothetical protein
VRQVYQTGGVVDDKAHRHPVPGIENGDFVRLFGAFTGNLGEGFRRGESQRSGR